MESDGFYMAESWQNDKDNLGVLLMGWQLG